MQPRLDHVLPDGTTIGIRRIRPDDKRRMLDMWARTSAESRRARFMGPYDINEDNVARFTDLDPSQEVAVVATRGRGEAERILGVARYVRDPDQPHAAEFAALVEDAVQGTGIGTALLRELTVLAAADGIAELTGDILANNSRMLNLVRELGLEYRSRHGGGVVHSDLQVELTESFLRVVDDSERQAAAAALQRFFHPERVAVVGASRNRDSIGGLVFHNVLDGGFSGVVYPVNRSATHVQGVAAYPSLAACPDVPDLAIICVPSHLVNDLIDEAGELGVKAVCIVTAGFAEIGGEGIARQEDLIARARGFGLRVVGPNCMGLLNGHAEVRFNGTFSSTFPRPGRVSMSSQSGALGLAVLEHVHELGFGISTFVSVGNKADISGNDLLLYWEDDPHTDVILMYLESFGNPRKFSRIARRISLRKPIVVVKSGRTSSGVRAASSHTAAISSGDSAVAALFEQTGVIRTETLEELFDVATLLATQGLPRGRKVAVLTNAGGPGILAADALEAYGLDLPRLSDRTIEELRRFLPEEAGVANPIDMIASASPETYAQAIRVLAEADEIDSVFVIFVATPTAGHLDISRALIDAKRDLPPDVPLLSVFMSSSQQVPAELAEAGIPTFAFPEAAARALGRVRSYARWRRRPLGRIVEPEGMDREAARSLVDAVLRGGDEPSAGVDEAGIWATNEQAEALLRCYGIPLARSVTVTSPEQGAEAQRHLDVPVAVKLDAPIHKADVGGVALDLTSPEAVSAAIERIHATLVTSDLDEHAGRFIVQEMIGEGIEMVVGVSHDPSFGPVVVTGMGGTLVELLRDVSVRVTPLTDTDVEEMLATLRMAPLLHGYRGSPPTDRAALRDLLYRVNAMVEDLPEVSELDLNPVFVRPEGRGVVVADLRLRLTAAG